MTLQNFNNFSASSLKEATAILLKADGKATVIAGGTDLLGVLKDKIHSESPEVLVDLKTIPSLSYVKESKKGIRIGALTTLHEIVTHKTIRDAYGLLAEAARSVASPQIRNMGTVGGNICQEPRCWYYRVPDDVFHCLRKGGEKCSALLGENRYHSIYGGARVSEPACTKACPGNVEIAAYMSNIRSGDIHGAAEVLLSNNPIPAITGRVCPHFCESKCYRSDYDEAVSIQNVERIVGDYILDHAAEFMKPPKQQRKQHIAIVGSGPAGLSAAFYLRKAGYKITLFDKMPEAGGMLTYGIPAYRLPKEIVQRQVKALEGMGIEFKQNATIGQKGKTLKDLRKTFDRLFLATGAWGHKTLTMEKSELLTSGLDFLITIGLGKKPPLGNRVLVIGGGNVAMDVAVNARHLGAKHVTMACLESREIMPAFPEEIEQALREGIELLPSLGPHRILEKTGRISGMEFVRCTSVFDEEGRFNPSFDLSMKQTVKADQIILAIGQSTDLSYIDKSIKTERGLILIDEETKTTSQKGVFAGGDVTNGPDSVIAAIAAGRKAALSITKSKPASYLFQDKPLDIHAQSQDISERTKKLSDLSDIQSEAARCANCGCVAVNASDMAPALIALDAKITTTKRTLNAEDFFKAEIMRSTVLDEDELVKEIEIPAQKKTKKQGYLKFRIRNSIDFPIVSLAYAFHTSGGIIKDARIIVGAVAPIPLRIRAVEEYIEGKPANEGTAVAAGDIAVREVQALSRNKFKVQIVRALIKKMLL